MNIVDLSVLSHHNEALSTKLALTHAEVCELKVWLDASEVQLDASEAWCQASEARHQALEAMLWVSDAHAMICNFKNQDLHHQLAEKTRTCKKCKINMEGCIITPLEGAALFSQQDADHQEKQAAEEAKKKSKTDTILLREHQCLLAVG